ncbi:MAG: hypothetical protein ACRDSN_11590, partial [Pseudonocardiaceae bacterium]
VVECGGGGEEIAVWPSARQVRYPVAETRAEVPGLTAAELVDVTLAVAWVLETTAILDLESLRVSS